MEAEIVGPFSKTARRRQIVLDGRRKLLYIVAQ
jgi:hypothetical protein